MDIFKRMFALIGENGQGIGTSSFGHWVKNVAALDLMSDERFAVDGLIDECYAHLDEGKCPHDDAFIIKLFDNNVLYWVLLMIA